MTLHRTAKTRTTTLMHDLIPAESGALVLAEQHALRPENEKAASTREGLPQRLRRLRGVVPATRTLLAARRPGHRDMAYQLARLGPSTKGLSARCLSAPTSAWRPARA